MRMVVAVHGRLEVAVPSVLIAIWVRFLWRSG